MRKRFTGWYPRSPEEAAAIWDAAIFVPDANVLLHCLRHPENVREELLRLFNVLKDSLWIPYQVGLEFHRNRLDVEFGAQDAYDRVSKDCETALNQARERLRQLRAHPVISVERELAALDMFITDFRGRMDADRENHPAEAIAAAVDRLTELLDGRVGEKWKPEQFNALRKEGEERYSKKIPPGYKDSKKDAGEYDRFGDLCQRRSKISPPGRSKTSPLDVMRHEVLRVVPVVHRRDPRAGRRAHHAAGGGPRVGGSC